MVHDPARVFAEIVRFHEGASEDPCVDLDDFTLLPVQVQPERLGLLTLSIRCNPTYDADLVGIHSFVRQRDRIYLEELRTFGAGRGVDLTIDAADLRCTPAITSSVREVGRLRPAWNDDLLMTIDVRTITRIDLMLVFDRHPLTEPTEDELKAFKRSLLAGFKQELDGIQQLIDASKQESRD